MYKPQLLVATSLLLMISCASQKSDPQTALPPTADFIASPERGTTPLTVSFTDLSTGEVTGWHWDFGEDQFSTIPQPIHTYTSAGEYTVSLAVMGSDSSDVETKVSYIKVSAEIISWEDAPFYIGQTKVVEGTIVETYYAANTKGEPTFLNFHKPHQGYFKCIIWGSDREKFVLEFPPNPETYFLNKRVQVTGVVREHPAGSGVPEIILRIPTQIQVIEE